MGILRPFFVSWLPPLTLRGLLYGNRCFARSAGRVRDACRARQPRQLVRTTETRHALRAGESLSRPSPRRRRFPCGNSMPSVASESSTISAVPSTARCRPKRSSKDIPISRTSTCDSRRRNSLRSSRPTRRRSTWSTFWSPAIVDLVSLCRTDPLPCPRQSGGPPAVCHGLQSLSGVASGPSAASCSPASGRSSPSVPPSEVLLVHTLYHPAQRRALLNPEGGDVEVSQQDLRPLLRLIDTTDGEIPWADYQDDTERRLTELVEAKVTAFAESARRDGPMAGIARPTDDPTTRRNPPPQTGSSGTRRKAA